jgi:hypothetical protein
VTHYVSYLMCTKLSVFQRRHGPVDISQARVSSLREMETRIEMVISSGELLLMLVHDRRLAARSSAAEHGAALLGQGTCEPKARLQAHTHADRRALPALPQRGTSQGGVHVLTPCLWHFRD